MNFIIISAILATVPLFFIFPGSTFIHGAVPEPTIYWKPTLYPGLFIWKFSIFELWVFGWFFVFLLYRVLIVNKQKLGLFSLGPLKPLILFTIGGLAVGIFGTIANHGNVVFTQIRFFCEAMLLYVMALNLDLKGVKLEKYVYFIILLADSNAAYHLMAYLAGKGFYWEDLGYIVMGYGDILETYLLISLLVLSVWASSHSPITGKKWVQLGAMIVLSITTIAIFLSFRRSTIAMYIIGVITLLGLSKSWLKVRVAGACLLLFIVAVGFLDTTGEMRLSDKILTRIDSINVFKYEDIKSNEITSPSGHISEVINGWNCVKEHPLLGIGFGVEIKKRVGWTGEPFMVHNELLLYWIVMGIFGPLVFFSMYWIPMIYCYKRIRDLPYKRYQWFYLTIIGFAMAKFIAGLTFYPPMSFFLTESYLYFIVLGFAMNETLFIPQVVRLGD